MYMWNNWFTHYNTEFLGIDIEPQTPTDFDYRTTIAIADGTTYEWTGPQVDIIIDDGSHTSNDIIRAMDNWFKHVKSGGWYVVEDLAVQWRYDYGGSPSGSPATDSLKKIVDQLWQKDTVSVTEFHAYDEIVFLRKA
jgi:demethylmacrocin O-methyltransferase